MIAGKMEDAVPRQAAKLHLTIQHHRRWLILEIILSRPLNRDDERICRNTLAGRFITSLALLNNSKTLCLVVLTIPNILGGHVPK